MVMVIRLQHVYLQLLYICILLCVKLVLHFAEVHGVFDNRIIMRYTFRHWLQEKPIAVLPGDSGGDGDDDGDGGGSGGGGDGDGDGDGAGDGDGDGDDDPYKDVEPIRKSITIGARRIVFVVFM